MAVFFNKDETNPIVSPAYEEEGYTGWISNNGDPIEILGVPISYDSLLTGSEISTSNITTLIKKNYYEIDTTVVEASRGKIGEWGVFKMPPRNIG